MFYTDLKKHATEIINYKKKEMFPLRDDEIESYNNKKFYIFKKKFHDADDRNNDSNNDSEDDTYADTDGDEDFDVRKFHGHAAGHDDLMNTVMMIMIVIMNLMLESFMVMIIMNFMPERSWWSCRT